ncbi:MAG: UbiD family decarboxylase domain-containing protein [Planctomycetota bacterium]|jgi:UbiD family decarboxylase
MSLRKFLQACDADGDMVKVPSVIEPKHEIAAFVRKTCDLSGPALQFTVPGTREIDQVVGGVYGSKDRIKRIFDLDYGTSYCGKSDLMAIKRYVECDTLSGREELRDYISIMGQPNCQDYVVTNPNLSQLLPICTHNSKDAGPFITAGVNVVQWIDGVTHGLGIHRMHQIDDHHLGCLAPPNRRVGYPHYQASKNGKGVPMAVLVGAPPEVVLASQSKVNSDCEKYIVAANIREKRLQMAKCVTSDLLVPADTEIVLECTTIPNSEHDDTPFAEYPGTYSFRSNAFIVRVDAVTFRHNAVYQTVLTGRLPQEDSNLCAIPYAAEVYKTAKKLVPHITDIGAFIGNNVFDTIVCIKKDSNSQVENLMHALIGNKYLKSITIMDDDLQATEEDWRFAFNTRYQPNRDTIITNLGLGASLDPSSPLFQSTSKIAMDFTRPTMDNENDNINTFNRHSRAETVPMEISDDWMIVDDI